MSEQKPLHVQQAEGLRALADMIEDSPEVAQLASYSLRTFYTFAARKPEDHAVLARLALKHGARVEKDVTEKQYNLKLHFNDAVIVYSLASREEVCERVVTGTETVTETVPDPEKLAEVPTVEVTKIVEQVEWVCRPLLAAEQAPAVTS